MRRWAASCDGGPPDCGTLPADDALCRRCLAGEPEALEALERFVCTAALPAPRVLPG